MATGVYVIRNSVSGNIYIGSSSRDICARFHEHRCSLRKNNHDNSHLQHAWNKYGEDNFTFSTLEECTPEQCIEREQWWMDFLKPEYNIAPIAGSTRGFRHTEETKWRLGEAKRGKKLTEETKQRMSEAKRGKKLTEETTQRMSQAQLGNKKNLGKSLSEETKAKLSVALRGREVSLETRAKLSESLKAFHAQKRAEAA
jgi:group I intron endonuclease